MKIGAMILNKMFYLFASPDVKGALADTKFKVMKTTYYTYRMNRIIILISIFLLMLSLAVNAQNRSRNGAQTRNRSGSSTVESRDNERNARTSLNYDRRNTQSRSTANSNQGRFIERETKPKKQTYTYSGNDYKNDKSYYHKQNAYNKKHNNVHIHKHYYKKYYHPSPWTYYNYPVVFYHHNFGEYFYYGGRFYRYDWRHGYFTVDMPTHVYFDTIPQGYRRVYINGRVYYQYHDILFRYTPHGYKIVPRSSGIYFHVRF